MPDAVPHRYHSNIGSWSAAGLCDGSPFLTEPTLSVDVRKPRRSTFRVRGRVRSILGLRIDGIRLEPAWSERSPKVLRKGYGKGRMRRSPGENRGPRKSAQPPSTGRILERAGWHRLRLASPRMRATWVPTGKACPLPQVGCRSVDRRSSQSIDQSHALIRVWTGFV